MGMTAGGKGLGIVSILVGIIVMMLIGIITITAVVTSQGTNTWTAFTLLVILPIIIGATAILAYLRFG
jgi:hypothetical protein